MAPPSHGVAARRAGDPRSGPVGRAILSGVQAAELATVLAGHPPFDSVDGAAVTALADGARVARFADGELVLDAFAEPSVEVFVVVSGRVQLWNDADQFRDPADDRLVISVTDGGQGPGDPFVGLLPGDRGQAAEGSRPVSACGWPTTCAANGRSGARTHQPAPLGRVERVLRRSPRVVLCVYDRPGAGTGRLDLAVGHHPDVLNEQQFVIRASDDHIRSAGDVDGDIGVLTGSGPRRVRAAWATVPGGWKASRASRSGRPSWWLSWMRAAGRPTATASSAGSA
jgi:hypothetical protein